MASSLPPPRQKPETAATSGVRIRRIVSQRSMRRASYMSIALASAIWPMSAPAANAFSEPPSTMQRIASSSSSSRSASTSVPMTSSLRAFRASGRLSKTIRDRRLTLDEDDAHSLPSTNFRTASCGSSVAIERASQSRAWLTVWCQARSRQKLSCCLV